MAAASAAGAGRRLSGLPPAAGGRQAHNTSTLTYLFNSERGRALQKSQSRQRKYEFEVTGIKQFNLALCFSMLAAKLWIVLVGKA